MPCWRRLWQENTIIKDSNDCDNFVIHYYCVLGSPTVILGITSNVDEHDPLTTNFDLSLVPPNIKVDAERLSFSLFSDDQETETEFTDELLTTYMAAEDKDVVILFNPGGWGWRYLSDSPSWHSIFMGMQQELESNGVKALSLEYRGL